MGISFSNPTALWALLAFLPLLALPLWGQVAIERRRWIGVGLRALIGAALILGLAGTQLVLPVHTLTTVFVLDLSDSVPPAEQERAEDFIRAAVAEMPQGARAAIVAFGEDALIERLATESRDLPPVASAPHSARTDIGSALRLALALFPDESQKRVVVLSDGLQNVGDARRQAELAAARGVEVSVVSLQAPPADREAYLAGLEAPSAVREGQSFAVVAVVESTVAQAATLRLFGDQDLIASRQVNLAVGNNRVEFPLTAGETGFRRYRVEMEPTADTLVQNNLASGFTTVYGPPRVLLAEGKAGEATALRQALESTGIEVTVVPPAQIPSDPAALSSYDSVVLVDVPAAALSKGTMAALPVMVRELGRGLVMIGGEQGYGAGGYLRTQLEAALPVDMDVRSRTREPNVALVLVIDKSGSMGRCHCDNPNAQPGQYQRAESGLPKVDIAKDAALRAAQSLGPLDYFGVIAFDDTAHWVVPLAQLAEVGDIQAGLGGFQAMNGTNLFAGLTEGETALKQTSARVKHMVLLTDGWSRSGQYDALSAQLAEEGITLSIVAAGEGSAEYLQGLAEAGGGRYYAAPSMADVPDIFVKETIQAVGSYLIEEPFYPLPAAPSAVLQGFDPAALPALQGYNGTTAKDSAQVALVSSRGDPVLAQWQYGLGRSVAWTSDLKGRWAADWVDWERFNAFAAQMVGWTLPEPADEKLQATLRLDGADVMLEVKAVDDQGRPRDLLHTEATLIGPDLVSRTVKLEQTGAGRYEGVAGVSDSGTYLVQIVQRDAAGNPVAQRTSGLAVPYSPEYQRSGSGAWLLTALAEATDGKTLVEPKEAFAPSAIPASQAQPLWPVLLTMAALLFPVDVAVRRLRLSRRDWARFQAWVRARSGQQVQPAGLREPEVLGDLFAARERARKREARPIGEAAVKPEAPVTPREVKPTAPVVAKPATEESSGDAMARLREARDRARQRR